MLCVGMDTIAKMLEFEDGLDDLTLVQQSDLAALTRRFLAHLLEPAWFQTEATLAHARLFFREFKPCADAKIVAELAERSAAQREYFAQLMLDFCAVDPDLHDLPISRCLNLWPTMITSGFSMNQSILPKIKESD